MSTEYIKWDVCLADVPFEELPKSKVRPVVILDKQDVSILGLKMTSKPPRAGEYTLVQWKKAGLKQPTTVRVSKRLKLPNEKIQKKIGHLTPLDIAGIQKAISEINT